MLSDDKIELLMEYYEAANMDVLRARSIINIDTDIYNDMTDDEFMCMVVEADICDDIEILRRIDVRYRRF